jgi:ribose transport system permease protein
MNALARAAGWRRADLPLLVAGLCVVVILAVGTLYNTSFLSPRYLLQQGQVAAFLGLVAAGQMIVILLGHIDLSVPWTISAGAMLASGLGGSSPGGIAALPIALATGALIGLVNGLGIAYLRVPSMIFTLGVNAALQGLMVLYTGGSAPASEAGPLAQWLATGQPVPGVPNAIWVWAAVSALLLVLLRRMPLGRYIYAIGNRERAAYLSGVRVRRVVVLCFMLNSALCALCGVLLSGYSGKAYQGMGDAYLLPAIAAVVLGGTNILGGRGRYLGTVIGTVLVVLLQSILAVTQMPDAGRQIIYGVVILVMLLLYGRGRRMDG